VERGKKINTSSKSLTNKVNQHETIGERQWTILLCRLLMLFKNIHFYISLTQVCIQNTSNIAGKLFLNVLNFHITTIPCPVQVKGRNGVMVLGHYDYQYSFECTEQKKRIQRVEKKLLWKCWCKSSAHRDDLFIFLAPAVLLKGKR